MAFLNPSNQLLQIDTGNPRTFLYNASLALSIYAGLGENQVLGQRYYDSKASKANPSGAPAIYILVQYKSTAQPTPAAAPAPVYWTDETFTQVTGVSTESVAGLNGLAGYLLPNSTDITGLTAAQLQLGQCLIQVGGQITAAVSPAAIVAGDWIIGAAGNFTPARVASGTAPGVRTAGVALSAVAAGLCDILLNCDIV